MRVLIGHPGAVKELDGGVGNGVGAVGHHAVYRGQRSRCRWQLQVYVDLLYPLKGKVVAVLQTEQILLDVGHEKTSLVNESV